MVICQRPQKMLAMLYRGGDEFVVVLTSLSSIQDCLELVNRWLTACTRPVEVDGNVISVSTSIGVTLYPTDDVDAAQDLEVKNRSSLKTRIAQALLQHEFALYYQPKVNMRTGAVVGVEALIRWQHPEHGLPLPGTFLPLIKKNPLCEQIGAWVLESVIRQLGAWRCIGLQLPVSINISARQFQEEQFAVNLRILLARYSHVASADVELEILETSAL